MQVPIDRFMGLHPSQKRELAALARMYMHHSKLSLQPRLFPSSITTTTNNCQPPPQLQIRVADSMTIPKDLNTLLLEFGDLRS